MEGYGIKRCAGGRKARTDDTWSSFDGSHKQECLGSSVERTPSRKETRRRRAEEEEKTNLNCEKVFPFYIVLNFYESKKFRFHFIIRFGSQPALPFSLS